MFTLLNKTTINIAWRILLTKIKNYDLILCVHVKEIFE